MPVEIVTTPTKPPLNEVFQDDLIRMKLSFINEVDVKPYNGRTRVLKKFACFVGVDELTNLIAKSPADATFFKINFAVHQELIETCGEDITDAMTVIIETMNPDKVPYDQVGNFVVIPGYGALSATGPNPCCPSSNP